MNKYLLPFLFLVLMASCIPYKKVIYMQSKNGKPDEVALQKKNQYKLHSHDVLSIYISSPNPQVSEFFNLKATGTVNGSEISESGYIYLPVLDSVKVKDLTLPEVQAKLEDLVRAHVTDATVVVKLANFKITILGEVQAPGLISFEGTELTIFDALSMAKDITDFGNKTNVTLLRKEGNIEKFIILDLTSRDFIGSEYFYLQPNDVLYIAPLRAKNFKLNVSQIAILLGFSSLVIFIINTVKR